MNIIYLFLIKHTDGKLKLLYEVFPIAFICEKANGKATNESSGIL